MKHIISLLLYPDIYNIKPNTLKENENHLISFFIEQFKNIQKHNDIPIAKEILEYCINYITVIIQTDKLIDLLKFSINSAFGFSEGMIKIPGFDTITIISNLNNIYILTFKILTHQLENVNKDILVLMAFAVNNGFKNILCDTYYKKINENKEKINIFIYGLRHYNLDENLIYYMTKEAFENLNRDVFLELMEPLPPPLPLPL
jgi:hypothetical protein